MFPISRDPPEGGTIKNTQENPGCLGGGFQFLGIPPKGERETRVNVITRLYEFPISRDPPEGGTINYYAYKFGKPIVEPVSNF